MPRVIDRRQVQRLLARGAQLVDVLPSAEFGDRHLPGALNIPLRKLDDRALKELDPQKAVVTYCWDYQ
jgi:rhodanese-related sulfurtransferase